MKGKIALILLAIVLVVSLAALPACKAEEEEYSLKITVVGEGTTNPATGTYTKTSGASVTITAIPDTGYELDRWEGDVSGTDDSITVKMTSDKSVVAVFVEEEEEVGTVVFGWLSDLTGRTSSIQIPAADGVTDYTNWINDVEGGVSGAMGTVKIEIDICDTQYDVASAKEYWAAGVEKGWVAAGHLLSGLAEGLILEAERDHIPVLCGSWGLLAPGSMWMFGTGHAGLPACGAGEGVMAGIMVAEALGEPRPTKIGFIGGDAPYGPMFNMGIDDWCEDQGVEVKQVLFPCGSPDVTSDLLILKEWGAEWLYGTCPVSDHYVIQKCLRAMDWDVGLTVAN